MSESVDERADSHLLNWIQNSRWLLVALTAVVSAIGFLVEPASYFLGDLYVRAWLRELGFAYAEMAYSAERLHTIFVSHSLNSLAPLTRAAFVLITFVLVSVAAFLLLALAITLIAADGTVKPRWMVSLRLRFVRRIKKVPTVPSYLEKILDWFYFRGLIALTALCALVLVIYQPLDWVISKAKRDAQALQERGFVEQAGSKGEFVTKCVETSTENETESFVLVSCGTTECAVIGEKGLRRNVQRKHIRWVDTRLVNDDEDALTVCRADRVQAIKAADAKPNNSS